MSRIKKAANFIEKSMNIIFTLCGFLAVAFVILITGFLLTSGMPAIGKIGITDFLFGRSWASTATPPSYGILPFILTSVYG
ncbi:MAG: phosphate ABC transporter permease subunit PstC, partial [Oscillospiraceae bacterium]|nr:phosphate ABC transporter permease subunit PstC [Oscillospiraceae bacterium]